MAQIARYELPEYLASKIKEKELAELSKDFTLNYRKFVENIVLNTGYRRQTLLQGWIWLDKLYLRISCNQSLTKLYLNFYSRDLKKKKGRKNKRQKYIEAYDCIDEIKYTISHNTNTGYLEVYSRNFEEKLPKRLFEHLKENLLFERRAEHRRKSKKIIYKQTLLHRLVLACYLKFKKNQEVHHLDLDRKNNIFHNLVIADPEKHNNWHISYNRRQTNLETAGLENDWGEEIQIRDNAYSTANTIGKKKNYSAIRSDEEILFKVCYYSLIKKDKKVYFEQVGINRKGYYSQGTIAQIQKEYPFFRQYFASIMPEIF